MDAEDLRLDGNAAAGLLAELFGAEMTLNWTLCANCGTDSPVGRLVAYVHGMGTILRCPNCGNALIRVAHTYGHYRVDLRGVRTLRLADPAVRPERTP